MSTTIVSISSTNWFPIYGKYEHDSNITLDSYTEVYHGYTFARHRLFEQARSVSINKQTDLILTDTQPLLYGVRDTIISTIYVGGYTRIYHSNKLLYVDDVGVLRASASIPETDARTFFRVVPAENNTVNIVTGQSQYLTVTPRLPYGITAQPVASEDDKSTQQFKIYTVGGSSTISIYLDNPAPGYGPAKIERFWFSGDDNSPIQAIGVIADDDYSIDNPYLFMISNSEFMYTLNGMTKDHTWVRYNNTLIDSRNNKNVEVSVQSEGVSINKLIDLPYNRAIQLNGSTKRGEMLINMANVKNVMTPAYEYASTSAS